MCEGDITKYASVTDRYFEAKYKLNDNGEDHRVLIHSNKICIITLAPSHPILKDGKTVTKVNFNIDGKKNPTESKPSGKKHKNALKVQENSRLCEVECEDGSSYKLLASIDGMIIEVNENLITSPNLLHSKPESNGHIAILLPYHYKFDNMKKKLLSKTEYEEAIQKRLDTPS